MDKGFFRIIDANLNRTREGLRVCEDVARFIIADRACARRLKDIRHAATRIVLDSRNLSLKKLLDARDTRKDPLKFVDLKKQGFEDAGDVFMSNIQRAKESLRALEEGCRILDEAAARKYRRLRFDVYGVEKKVAGKIGNISGSG